MRILLLVFFFVYYGAAAQTGLQPVDSWREELPYQSAIDVTASATKVYAATPYSVFSVDMATKEVERMSKVSGLSEAGVTAIQYDEASDKLYIAYANSNIDVLEKNGRHNIADLKRKNIAGDKTIYHIYADNRLCYLSTGIGIIVLDAEKYEVKDSWFIGSSGDYVKINMVTKDNNYIYAATEDGLKKVSVNANAADYNAWQNVSGSKGLGAAACKGVVNIQNKIIAVQNDSLWIQNGTEWFLFFADGWPVISINASKDKITVCQRTAGGNSKVVILNSDGSINNTIQYPGIISFPKKAIWQNEDYWVADLYGGLSQWSGGVPESYKLNSPEDIATGEMTVYNNILYVAAGSVNSAWNYLYNGSGVYKLSNGEWTNYNRYHYAQLDSMLDFITVAADPRDESVWAGSYGGGLLHIQVNDHFTIYKQNSPIRPMVGDPASYRVSGLAFDHENNLWICNYGADQYIHVRKNDSTWQSFTSPYRLTENAVAQIVIDDADQKWIVSPKGGGLICFNSGSSIDDTGDDRWRLYRTGNGNGNLPSNNVLSIAKDKNGFIWVGTDDGVGIIQCPQEAFSNTGCEALLPVVKQGNFANYLFKGEQVQSIAVDGADRKWIATKNGAWLINIEGDQVLQHFTEDNSPLLNNNVKSIAINGTTGEVFFATINGICSYRSTATEASQDSSTVLIFPNPVPPGYGGTIAIKGLAGNSYVKITELNGRLVYQTKALGGQAVWNGRNYKGQPVASGIYLVLMIDEQGQQKIAGKIVFISN